MTEPVKNSKWKPGQTGNPNGRPKGPGKPVSRLRSTLNKLKDLEKPSIENIEKVINGDPEIDKLQVETSKWLISTLVAVTRAVVAEESNKLQNRSQDDSEEEKDNPTSGNVVKFTTKILE